MFLDVGDCCITYCIRFLISVFVASDVAFVLGRGFCFVDDCIYYSIWALATSNVVFVFHISLFVASNWCKGTEIDTCCITQREIMRYVKQFLNKKICIYIYIYIYVYIGMYT